MKTGNKTTFCLITGTMAIAVAVTLFVSGCSDQSDDSWYSDTHNQTGDRDEYIRTQSELGIDPAEARRDYDREVMRINTEGRNSSEIEYNQPTE